MNAQPWLDLEFVRSQFPAFAERRLMKLEGFSWRQLSSSSFALSRGCANVQLCTRQELVDRPAPVVASDEVRGRLHLCGKRPKAACELDKRQPRSRPASWPHRPANWLPLLPMRYLREPLKFSPV